MVGDGAILVQLDVFECGFDPGGHLVFEVSAGGGVEESEGGDAELRAI